MFFFLNHKTMFILLISWSLLELLSAIEVSLTTTSKAPSQRPPHNPQSFPEPEKTTFPMFVVNYPRIQIPFEITLWVLLASFAKIGKQTHVSSTESLKTNLIKS